MLLLGNILEGISTVAFSLALVLQGWKSIFEHGAAIKKSRRQGDFWVWEIGTRVRCLVAQDSCSEPGATAMASGKRDHLFHTAGFVLCTAAEGSMQCSCVFGTCYSI